MSSIPPFAEIELNKICEKNSSSAPLAARYAKTSMAGARAPIANEDQALSRLFLVRPLLLRAYKNAMKIPIEIKAPLLCFTKKQQLPKKPDKKSSAWRRKYFVLWFWLRFIVFKYSEARMRK
jgi:hypothetical protein